MADHYNPLCVCPGAFHQHRVLACRRQRRQKAAAAGVQAVPAVLKFIPGGSAILGFLVAGAAIGPFGLGLILDTEPVKHLAEIGVIFLLFNLGLELSLERLIALAKQVFVLGTLQFTMSTLAIAGVATVLAGYSGPAAVIVGGALALSSTAVVMKIMQERSETGSRHGRATFAILLFQDLAVVVLLMLVPLLAAGGTGVPPSTSLRMRNAPTRCLSSSGWLQVASGSLRKHWVWQRSRRCSVSVPSLSPAARCCGRRSGASTRLTTTSSLRQLRYWLSSARRC